MTKLVGAGILISCSLTTVAGQPGAPQRGGPKLSTMIDRVRPSVVQIISFYDPSTGLDKGTGTGFFVSPDGIVVTAKHVITSKTITPCDTSPLKPYQPPQPIQLPQFGIPQPPPPPKPVQAIKILIAWPQESQRLGNVNLVSNFATVRARVLACDDKHDIAVLEPERNPLSLSNQTTPPMLKMGDKSILVQSEKLRPSVLSSNAFRDGDPIFTSGYPLENATLITTSGSIASSKPVGVDEVTGKFEDVYLADIHVNPGNSGGPAFSLEAGTVIGMVRAYQPAPDVFDDDHSRAFLPAQTPDHRVVPRYLDSNSGIGEIIPVEFIVRLLHDNKVKFSAR
jgi:S1-C subfamily serine protease